MRDNLGSGGILCNVSVVDRIVVERELNLEKDLPEGYV